MHKDSHWIMRCMIQRRQLFRRVKTDGITPQLKGWILCYTVDPPNLIPSNRQVIRRSKVSANHLIIRVIKYCRAETTARFRGPSGVYLST